MNEKPAPMPPISVSPRTGRIGCALLALWFLSMSAVAVGQHSGQLEQARAWLNGSAVQQLYAEN